MSLGQVLYECACGLALRAPSDVPLLNMECPRCHRGLADPAGTWIFDRKPTGDEPEPEYLGER